MAEITLESLQAEVEELRRELARLRLHGPEHELPGEDAVRLSVQNGGTQLNRQRTLNAGTGITATEDSTNKRITLSTTDGDIDHGSLAGLSDDDHTQYGALAQDESVTGQWTLARYGTGAITSYDVIVGAPADYGMLQIGNASFGRTSYNVTNLDLDGTMLFRNIGAPATSNIEFVFAESANAIRFAIPKSGTGFATYNARSMLIAGPAALDDTIVTIGYWQGQGIFDNLVCDTGGDGADLGVQNDLEVEGDIFVDSILESTAAAGVTIETVLLKDGDVLPSSQSTAKLTSTLLSLDETTTPSADAGYGKFYTKTDDHPYFQDGAGTEHIIMDKPITKDSDETINNSATFQNDDDLSFSVAANEVWMIELHIEYTGGSATSDIKWQFTGPAGATASLQTNYWDTGLAISMGGNIGLASAILAGTASGFDLSGHIYGIVTVGGTAGTIQFQWAQNVAEGVDTTVYAGTYMKIQKVA